MGKLFDKIISKLTGNTSLKKAMDDNKELDDAFQKSAGDAIVEALEEKTINMKDDVKGLAEIKDKSNKSVLEKKEITTALSNLKSQIKNMKAGYKSKDLTDLLKDQEIFEKIKNETGHFFESEVNFSKHIGNDVIQFIINNKTLLKKYKDYLSVEKWLNFLKELPMNSKFNLGCAGADIRTELYGTKPTPSTEDAPNPKLVSWLTILGPASLKSKKRVNSIKNIVKKRIASIADKIDNEKTNNNIDLTNGIIGQCQKYLKNKKSVDVYLCLALTYSDTIKTLNTIGNTLVQKEGEQRTWKNIKLQKIDVSKTPKKFAESLQRKLNAATSKDSKYSDDTEINYGKRPNLDD